MTIAIKILQRGDETVLANVAPDVFDNEINAELTKEFLNDPRHHLAVAIEDELVIGFASAVHYVHPDKHPELWINEVGVAPTHQKRGLGKHYYLRFLQLVANLAVAKPGYSQRGRILQQCGFIRR